MNRGEILARSFVVAVVAFCIMPASTTLAQPENPKTASAQINSSTQPDSATSQPGETGPTSDTQPTTSAASTLPAEEATSRPKRRTAQDHEPQPAGATIIIADGRILTMDADGSVVNGTLAIRDGKIASIQEGEGGGPGGRGTTRIDAKGRYVTPGLIDAAGVIGVAANEPDTKPGGRSSLRAADTIDVYASHAFEEALRQGVTAICVEPASGNGVAGLASLVRLDLTPGGTASAEAACLVIRVGVGNVGPFGRLEELKRLRDLFTSARDYKEAWEEYEEELEKYKKELKSGKAVKLKKDGEDADASKGGKPTPPRSTGGYAEHDHDAHEPAARRMDRGWRRCPQHPWIVVVCCCPENHENEETCEHDHVEHEPLPEWLTLDVKPGREKKDASEKKEGELAKPDRPSRDPDQETLVKVLNRDLPVRFEVHRPADILNILELIREFNLDAAISGAAGAGYVADAIAEAEVPVILSVFIPTAAAQRNHLRPFLPDAASKLEDAGVHLTLGSGTADGRFRSAYLSQMAALAVSGGLPRDAALRVITIEAAKRCGAADQIGSLEKGKLGDVVVWKGHPLASDAVVEYVFVGGVQRYPRVP